MSWLSGHGWGFQVCVEGCLSFCVPNVSDGFEQTAIVESIHPFEGRAVYGFEAAPYAATMNGPGLEQAADDLGQSVIIAVADAADRRLDARFLQWFGVFYGQVMAAKIRAVDKPHALGRAAADRLMISIRQSLLPLSAVRNFRPA